MTGAKPACNRHCNAQAGQKDKQAGMFFDRNHLSAMGLPGFGERPMLAGKYTLARLADAVAERA